MEPSSTTILVAEDELVMRKVVCKHLENAGFNVSNAPDGQAAWEILTAQKEPVDLLITDIDMPHLKGDDLIRRLRKEGFRIPVLVMTGVGDKELVVNLLRLGVESYLDKPFSKEELLAQVHTLLTGFSDPDDRSDLIRLRQEMSAAVQDQVKNQIETIKDWIRGGVKHRFNQPLTVLNAGLTLMNKIKPEDFTSPERGEIVLETLADLQNASACLTDLVTLLSRLDTIKPVGYVGDDSILDFESSQSRDETSADGN